MKKLVVPIGQIDSSEIKDKLKREQHTVANCFLKEAMCYNSCAFARC